jgi:hypothetical protein
MYSLRFYFHKGRYSSFFSSSGARSEVLEPHKIIYVITFLTFSMECNLPENEKTENTEDSNPLGSHTVLAGKELSTVFKNLQPPS